MGVSSVGVSLMVTAGKFSNSYLKHVITASMVTSVVAAARNYFNYSISFHGNLEKKSPVMKNNPEARRL